MIIYIYIYDIIYLYDIIYIHIHIHIDIEIINFILTVMHIQILMIQAPAVVLGGHLFWGEGRQ